jgi:hypothetical protein
MNKITSFTIDTSEMPTAETLRSFTVKGTIGSQFFIQAIQDGTIKYYDFVSGAFEDGHNNVDNNLTVTLASTVYYNNITFPSGGGNYVIILITLPGTELKFGGGGNIISKSIAKQSSNSTITFKAFTANTSSYATFPTSTTAGALADSANLSFDWDITNASTDANGFGLIPTGEWDDLNTFTKLWFFKTTETVDGAVSPTDINEGFVVIVDDLTDIGVGSYISAVSAGSLNGLPVVIAINTDAKQITLNLAQTFADGITLTFRAYGTTNIYNAIGASIGFSFDTTNDEILFTNRLTKTIRAGSSGTTINLNGTYGVGHNADLAFISGVGLTRASVQTVTASSSAGSMTVDVSQGTLVVGTNVYFESIFQVFNIVGKITVKSYPSANQTIYLDIDKFLTPGTAS